MQRRMYVKTFRGPCCQSCGMPLRRPADRGTDAKGLRIDDYCHHCYVAGRFTEPTALNWVPWAQYESLVAPPMTPGGLAVA